MTTLLITIGILLVGITTALLIRTLVLPRLRFETHLSALERYGFTGNAERQEANVARGSLNAALNAAATSTGRTLMATLPRLAPLSRGELSAAGYYELSPETIHGYRAMATLFFPALIMLYAAGTGAVTLVVIVLMAVIGLSGWHVPALLVRMRGRRRLNLIDRDLPQFIDLLVATVEAGSAFGGALDTVAHRVGGPLGDELRLTMRQKALGISTEQALGDMLERCETASVRAFVRTVIRAESHGSSIGPVLRHLAGDIRQRRRELAREKIQKAPIKMLFPLVLLILPALLMVILYPAMYNIVRVLSHA